MVLKELDKNNFITHRLYRQHTLQEKGIFLKSLNNLGRDLNKTIIIDNVKENFKNNPENGLHIKHFLGNPNDSELFEIIKDLKSIYYFYNKIELVNKKVPDVRIHLPLIRAKMSERLFK